MTAQWADDVHHALHTYLTGERHGYYVDFGSVETLDKAYRKVFVHDGSMSTFRGKPWGAPVPADDGQARFVVCASNHDQVGNRALGDRPSSTLTPGGQAASLALVLLAPSRRCSSWARSTARRGRSCSSPTTPSRSATAVSEGRMSEFAGHGWEDLYGGDVDVPDPQDRQTFVRSKLGPGSGGTERPAATRSRRGCGA